MAELARKREAQNHHPTRPKAAHRVRSVVFTISAPPSAARRKESASHYPSTLTSQCYEVAGRREKRRTKERIRRDPLRQKLGKSTIAQGARNQQSRGMCRIIRQCVFKGWWRRLPSSSALRPACLKPLQMYAHQNISCTRPKEFRFHRFSIL